MMTDRETLEKVARDYNDLIALHKKQKQTMVQLIRACVVQLQNPDSRKRKEAINSLRALADMLEKQT